MTRDTTARDQDIIRRHNLGEKAGRLAAEYDVPVSRVWRVLAMFWQAEAEAARDEALAMEGEVAALHHHYRAQDEADWTVAQLKRVRAILSEPSAGRRMYLLGIPLSRPLPDAEIHDLRRRNPAEMDVEPRQA